MCGETLNNILPLFYSVFSNIVAGQNATIRFGRGRRPRGPT
jgi:hypothetical protein